MMPFSDKEAGGCWVLEEWSGVLDREKREERMGFFGFQLERREKLREI